MLQCKFTKEWLKSMCDPLESLMVSLVPGTSLVSNKTLLMSYKLALGYGMKIKPQPGEALGLAGA